MNYSEMTYAEIKAHAKEKFDQAVALYDLKFLKDLVKILGDVSGVYRDKRYDLLLLVGEGDKLHVSCQGHVVVSETEEVFIRGPWFNYLKASRGRYVEENIGQKIEQEEEEKRFLLCKAFEANNV